MIFLQLIGIIVLFYQNRFPFGFWYLGRGDSQAREYRDGHAASGKQWGDINQNLYPKLNKVSVRVHNELGTDLKAFLVIFVNSSLNLPLTHRPNYIQRGGPNLTQLENEMPFSVQHLLTIFQGILVFNLCSILTLQGQQVFQILPFFQF